MSRVSDVAAGARDQRISLVPITQSEDTSGMPIEVDALEADWIAVMAAKYDLGGRERFSSDQESAPYDTRWSLPYAQRFDPDVVNVPKVFALMHRGRRYDIIAASMIGRRAGVELLTMSRNG